MAASVKGDGQFLSAMKKRARKRTAVQADLDGLDSTTDKTILSPETVKSPPPSVKASPKKKTKTAMAQATIDEALVNSVDDTIDAVIKNGGLSAEQSTTTNAIASPEVKHSPKKRSRKKAVVVTSPGSEVNVKVEHTDDHGDEDHPADSRSLLSVKPDDEVWTTDNITTLLERIESHLPKGDKIKYTTQVEKMDWEDIKFNHFTGEDCKQKWNTVVLRLRRFRTMTDLVKDAQEWVKVPWSCFGKKMVHPDLPKRPLSPYLRFFMEKVPKFRKENPNLQITGVAKIIAEKFRALPEKKKQKYGAAFNSENELYKRSMEKFRSEHPEMYPVKAQRESRGHKESSKPRETVEKIVVEKVPIKPPSVQQLFVNAKLEEKMISEPQLTKKDAIEDLRKKWASLKNSKKMKYITLAMEGQKQYDKEMEEYCGNHPDYQPKTHRAVLTKAEQKVRDHHFGKPEKPPNGYAYFSSSLLSKLTDIPSTERMSEIARRWKTLSDKEREKYAKTAEQKMKAYKEEYEKYKERLPEDERKKLEEKIITHKRAPKANGVASLESTNDHPRPKKPMSALFMFINEKKDKFKQKYPTMSDQDIVRLLSKAYSALTDQKREKYKKIELEQKNHYQQEIQEYFKSHPQARTGKENNKMKMLYPGAPKKPPGSGYQLFAAEMMGKLTDIPSKLRLQEVSTRWKSLGELERVSYNQRRVQMVDEYRKAVEIFKAGLSIEERERFEESIKGRSRKNNNKECNSAGIQEKFIKTEIKTEIKQEVEESEEESSEGEEESGSGEEEEDGKEESSEEDGSGEEEEEEESEEEEEESEDEKEPKDVLENAFPIPTKSTTPEQMDGEKESSSGSESESESSDSSTSGESSSEAESD